MADTAQCYMNLTAFGKASASIVGRGTEVNPLRMKVLGEKYVEVTETLTWDALARINKSWGGNTTVSYGDVNSTYVWNPTTGVFTITNSAGTVTALTGKYEVEDLEVSWDVIPNVLVVLQILDSTNANVFLIGSLSTKTKDSQVESITWGTSEYLAVGTQHALFSRISEFTNVDGVTFDALTRAMLDCTVLLLQDGGVWVATNNYELSLLDVDTNLDAERPEQSRNGNTEIVSSYVMISIDSNLLSSNSYIIYEPSMLKEWADSLPSSSRAEQSRAGFYKNLDYLMIALFAQNLLSSNSNITYEPWMLWEIFQWYFKSTDIVANSRRIFDLSPRWG